MSVISSQLSALGSQQSISSWQPGFPSRELKVVCRPRQVVPGQRASDIRFCRIWGAFAMDTIEAPSSMSTRRHSNTVQATSREPRLFPRPAPCRCLPAARHRPSISAKCAMPVNSSSSFFSKRKRFWRISKSSVMTRTPSKKRSTAGRSVEISSSAPR